MPNGYYYSIQQIRLDVMLVSIRVHLTFIPHINTAAAVVCIVGTHSVYNYISCVTKTAVEACKWLPAQNTISFQDPLALYQILNMSLVMYAVATFLSLDSVFHWVITEYYRRTDRGQSISFMIIV